MGLSAIECPDGVCHSHHGGHAVERETMQSTLQLHGKDSVSYTHLTLPTKRIV